MAGNVLVDAGFLIALLSRRDRHHPWAAAQAPDLAPPWRLAKRPSQRPSISLGLRADLASPAPSSWRRLSGFELAEELHRVSNRMQKYSDSR